MDRQRITARVAEFSARHFEHAFGAFHARRFRLVDVIVAIGAARTVINADYAAEVGILLDRTNRPRMLRRVGGREFVFVGRIDRFAIGDHGLNDFEIEVGEMDYGFEIGGIINRLPSCGIGDHRSRRAHDRVQTRYCFVASPAASALIAGSARCARVS